VKLEFLSYEEKRVMNIFFDIFFNIEISLPLSRNFA